MQRPFSDWGGNLGAYTIVIVVNVLSNTSAIGQRTMAEISAQYPSPFTPAGFTFSIWGLIYVALLAFVVYQALPGQRGNETIAGISRLFQLNCVANASWLVAWHHDLLLFSVLLMLVLLITLVMIYLTLADRLRRASVSEYLLLQFPFSLYTAWITLATIANVSAVQTAHGWDDFGLTATSWTLLKLALAASVGATMLLRRGDVVFALVVAWGAYGISVMQSQTPTVAAAATTVAFIALLLAMWQSVCWLVRRTP